MTKLEILEKVSAHLLAQNAKSMFSHKVCAYRGKDGLKCAIGCLIPDDLYNSYFEGNGVGIVGGIIYALRFAGIDCEEVGMLTFLRALQSIHDTTPPEMWELQLRAMRERMTST